MRSPCNACSLLATEGFKADCINLLRLLPTKNESLLNMGLSGFLWAIATISDEVEVASEYKAHCLK